MNSTEAHVTMFTSDFQSSEHGWKMGMMWRGGGEQSSTVCLHFITQATSFPVTTEQVSKPSVWKKKCLICFETLMLMQRPNLRQMLYTVCAGKPVEQDKTILLSPSPLRLPSTFQFCGISRLAMAKATRRSMAQRELCWPRLKRLLSSLWSVELRQCPWITRCSASSWNKAIEE